MIDIIGRLYDQPADPEAAPIELPGWHVNVTHDVLAEHSQLLPYTVEPSPLRRVWAGDDPAAPVLTVPLRFEDEASANEVLDEAGLLPADDEETPAGVH